jgi:hypothetical protein
MTIQVVLFLLVSFLILSLALLWLLDWLHLHASPNVAKTVLDWDYVIEILRIHLRMRLADQHQARPDRALPSHEGSFPQGPGASHAQIISSESQALGGDRHV